MKSSSPVNERDAPPELNQAVIPDFETGEAKPDVEGVIVVDGDELMMEEEFKHFYGDADAKPKRDAIGDSSFYWPNGRYLHTRVQPIKTDQIFKGTLIQKASLNKRC